MSTPAEITLTDAGLAFRSIARISSDLMNSPLDARTAEMVWAIFLMAEAMAEKIEEVES